MSADIANHMHMIAPLRVVQHRVERDIAAEILPGLIWNNTATLRVDGADDLPNISFVDYNANEEIGPGSMRDQLIMTQPTVSMWLNTWKDNGFYAQTALTDDWGLMEWIIMIQESIERDDANAVDYTLDGTLDKPFTFNVSASGVTDLTYTQIIEISYSPKWFRRGTRSDIFSSL